jgi:hypothetical protein
MYDIHYWLHIKLLWVVRKTKTLKMKESVLFHKKKNMTIFAVKNNATYTWNTKNF